MLVIAYQADVSGLIQLYIIGVFVSFTLSQLGMVRHWTRHLRSEERPRGATAHGALAGRSTRFGLVMTGSVLVIVLATKFTKGAWIVVIAMPIIWLLMKAIHKHYERVSHEISTPGDAKMTLPARVHVIVLVSKIHKPTLRALEYARATRPTVLEAVTVDVDHEDTNRLQAEWERQEIPVTLKILASPYREITRPILDYVNELRSDNPNDLVTGLHPGVRRGPLVGAPAAQPVRAAAEEPAAVHPRRHGHQRAVAAALQRAGDQPGCLTGPGLAVGDERIVEIGPVAHGGHFVAHSDGRTLFVRHALTGERARVRVTEVTRKIVRADAVEILEPSADRVPAPCPWAHPGGCGGCDFQHVIAAGAARASRAQVLRDALSCGSGMSTDAGLLDGLSVEELPGHPDGLHWRTRMTLGAGPGRPSRPAPAPQPRRRARSTPA